MIAGPRVVRVRQAAPSSGGAGGVPCCGCCRCCSCLHFAFLSTTPGKIKVAEAVLGAVCQGLLVRYGLQQSALIGKSFYSFLTTASACLLTTSVLIASYLLSEKSFSLVRSSLFETLFNGTAAFLYLSASSYLAHAVLTDLWNMYTVTPFFQAYPAMTAAYVLGVVLGILHGWDAYLAYKHFRGIC
ncbi:protein singles bar [Schistocerca piceifrons]|uniref:protein singles bar n=1 Tax=Schistocerca piceifrons TaxID=274613 RepID=UPI001F5F8F9B|nr:protein singles bar [Schistocerca piceifrons]